MSDQTSIVADVLRVHGDLNDHEFDALVDHWTELDHRLQPFEEHGIKLDLYIEDRDTASQWVLLEARIGGCAPMVAMHESRNMDDCLDHARDELVRQLSDTKGRMGYRPHHHAHQLAARV
jgi:hypothetical protein